MSADRPGVPPPFRLEVEPHRATIVLAAHGEIDIATAEHLARRLRELIDAGFRRVALDLRGVSFIDSTGLRVVLEARAASAEAGVDFALIPGPEPVQRVFELTGTATLLDFVDATTIDRR